MPSRLLILCLLPLLGACASTPQYVPATVPQPRQVSTSVPPTDPAPVPPSSTARAARVMSIAGLDAIIGQGGDALLRQFGPARLDVKEGDARKLQFSGEACVLDIYLYPQQQGREPVATWVEARRGSDGLDVDRAACANALKRR